MSKRSSSFINPYELKASEVFDLHHLPPPPPNRQHSIQSLSVPSIHSSFLPSPFISPVTSPSILLRPIPLYIHHRFILQPELRPLNSCVAPSLPSSSYLTSLRERNILTAGEQTPGALQSDRSALKQQNPVDLCVLTQESPCTIILENLLQ